MVQARKSSAAVDVVIPMYNEVSRLDFCLEQLMALHSICLIQDVFCGRRLDR